MAEKKNIYEIKYCLILIDVSCTGSTGAIIHELTWPFAFSPANLVCKKKIISGTF